jgi:soluble lytic murein transglycosylase-like protein
VNPPPSYVSTTRNIGPEQSSLLGDVRRGIAGLLLSISSVVGSLVLLMAEGQAEARHAQEPAGNPPEPGWRRCLDKLETKSDRPQPGPVGGSIASYLSPYIRYGSEFVKYTLAIIYVESRFRPDAISPMDAYGLMQMTEIAVREAQQECGLRHVYDMRHLLDPTTNIEYGICYLRMLYTELEGNWTEVLLVYNGGYRQLTRYRESLTIASETANYVLQVQRVLGMCN